MAANFEDRSSGTFRLFSSSGDSASSASGFFGAPELSLPAPPPCVEVLSSEASSSVKYTLEPLELDGLTMLKGRVSTKEVFALSNTDLIPGKYEGGLKLWEGSLDLVKAIRSEVRDGQIVFTGKHVLELGCGHGLPGIFACLEGSASVHFQDFNAEVLKCLTIPNVNANLNERDLETEVRYFAGDWSGIDKLLPHSYDIILMAETVYSTAVLQKLYDLIKKCMSDQNGTLYMAAKKHYFGVGGGTRDFLSIVEKDGVMKCSMVAEVADGSSNVREVWKLSFK